MENLGLRNPDPNFWHGKRVFITGHTGFKGAWLSLWLTSMGAIVSGFSKAPTIYQPLFNLFELEQNLASSTFNDLLDLESLKDEIHGFKPEIVFHLAAQSLVRESYANPVQTYASNIMGTVNLLDACRGVASLSSILVVSSDKCYENKEWAWGYRETDDLGGFDPYSNSKGCVELIVNAYRRSFFNTDIHDGKCLIATARAGNVIGGGDQSPDRLVPDIFRSIDKKSPIYIRNPYAIRPWQHVLEPLSAYLLLAQNLYTRGSSFASAWNFGPREKDSISVQEMLNLFSHHLKYSLNYRLEPGAGPHESVQLRLDCSKALQLMGWEPRWNVSQAVEMTINWQLQNRVSGNIKKFSLSQIDKFIKS